MKIRYYLAALSLAFVAACGPSQPYSEPYVVQQQVAFNPCEPATYEPVQCQQAINQRGYYNGGVFVAMTFPHPYSYYNQTYTVYRSRGGVIRSAPSGYYSRSYVRPSAPRSTYQSGGFSGSRSTTYSAPRSTYSAPRSTYSAPRRSTFSSPSRSSFGGSSRSTSSSRRR